MTHDPFCLVPIIILDVRTSLLSLFKTHSSEEVIYNFQISIILPIFLDVHKVPFKESHLRQLMDDPADEYGVRHVNLFYNKEASVCFCLLSAPDREAVVKHHDKVDIKCEWITEVTMATGEQFFANANK